MTKTAQSAYAKINSLNAQEKFQKAVPLGAAEREACSEAERGWIVLKFLLDKLPLVNISKPAEINI